MTSVQGYLILNMKRLYMHDKPGRLGRPPHKSSTTDSVLFKKEDDFSWHKIVVHIYV